jgi:Na+/H+ antiporter NhaA
VAGAIAIVVILLIFPVLAAMGGVVIAALLGSTLHKDGEARHEGSELIDLNV